MTNILMCQNIPVLNIDDFKVLNKELLPIGLFSHKDFLFRARFKEWLQLRDFRHRKNFKYFISQNSIVQEILSSNKYISSKRLSTILNLLSIKIKQLSKT